MTESNDKEMEADNLSNEELSEKESNSDIEIEVTDNEEEKLSLCEEKLQRALADYQNLERRNTIEISQKILQKTNQLMLSFIGIYEDFIRARISLVNDNSNTDGIDVVIKNMENFLSENNIEPIEAKGKIFDPKFHEAVSTVEDDSLDDGTITEEVAKGYISFQEVIKPSKVIVSKKSET